MEEFYIQWHLTNLCNLRCRHCYQEYFNSAEDLPWIKLKTIYENLLSTAHQWNKKINLTLTGGEPLLKKESFLLLEYLEMKDEISELSLITNGSFLNEEVCQHLDGSDKFKKIKISLDGGSEKINDYIRGKGTFSKVMKAIETVKKCSNFQIILMFTVMKSNLQEIEDMFNLCKEFQLDGLMIERFIPLGQGVSIEEQILDKEEWKSLTNTLFELCKINPALACKNGVNSSPEEILPYRAFQIKFNPNSPIHQSTIPLIHQFANSPTLELLGASCTAGTDGLCIMPDGIVYPCRRFNLPVGNLLKQPLSEIWQNSEVLNKIREKNNLQGKCKKCSIKECRGCRAVAFALTGDYLAEDSQCWY